MPSVTIRDTDSFELALKKFKKQCEKEGILSDIRKREHYEKKPSVKRKKKMIAARKKAAKKIRMNTR